MLSIINWRMAQCEARGVEFRFNVYAEAHDVIALNPDIVVIATGGSPNTELFENGSEQSHVVNSWDISSASVKPAQRVLIYDESGDHPALQAAEVSADAGSVIEIMTPDRILSPEIMGMNLVSYMRMLQDNQVTYTVGRRLLNAYRSGNKLSATIGTDYSDMQQTQDYDQVALNYSTLPNDDLYFSLKDQSVNPGSVHHDALIDGRPQAQLCNTGGRFLLFRIGDAISSRNTHAAIYDALRIMKDL